MGGEGQGKGAPTFPPHRLHGLDAAWCVALVPHREGTRCGIGRRQTGSGEADESRSAEEGRGDRLAAPADRGRLASPSCPSPAHFCRASSVWTLSRSFNEGTASLRTMEERHDKSGGRRVFLLDRGPT